MRTHSAIFDTSSARILHSQLRLHDNATISDAIVAYSKENADAVESAISLRFLGVVHIDNVHNRKTSLLQLDALPWERVLYRVPQDHVLIISDAPLLVVWIRSIPRPFKCLLVPFPVYFMVSKSYHPLSVIVTGVVSMVALFLPLSVWPLLHALFGFKLLLLYGIYFSSLALMWAISKYGKNVTHAMIVIFLVGFAASGIPLPPPGYRWF